MELLVGVILVATWLNDITLVSISVVALRWVGLVLGWVTASTSR